MGSYSGTHKLGSSLNEAQVSGIDRQSGKRCIKAQGLWLHLVNRIPADGGPEGSLEHGWQMQEPSDMEGTRY